MVAPGQASVFFGGWLSREEAGQVRFGDEDRAGN